MASPLLFGTASTFAPDAADLAGGIGDLAGGVLDALGPIGAVASLVPAAMSLFGGGGTSQNQSQNQTQSQSQTANATATASANFDPQNSFNTYYPNESPGMILQGLAGSQPQIPTAQVQQMPIAQAMPTPGMQTPSGAITGGVAAYSPTSTSPVIFPSGSIGAFMPSMQQNPMAAPAALTPQGPVAVPGFNTSEATGYGPGNPNYPYAPMPAPAYPAPSYAPPPAMPGMPPVAPPYAPTAGGLPSAMPGQAEETGPYMPPPYTSTPEQRALGGVEASQNFARTGQFRAPELDTKAEFAPKEAPKEESPEQGMKGGEETLKSLGFPDIPDPMAHSQQTAKETKKLQQTPTGLDKQTSDVVRQAFSESGEGAIKAAEGQVLPGTDKTLGQMAADARGNINSLLPQLGNYELGGRSMAQEMARHETELPTNDEEAAHREGDRGINAYNEAMRAGNATRPGFRQALRMALAQGYTGIQALSVAAGMHKAPNSDVAKMVLSGAYNAPGKVEESMLKMHQEERADLTQGQKAALDQIKEQRYVLSSVNKEIAQRAQLINNSALNKAQDAINNYYKDKGLEARIRGQDLMARIAATRQLWNNHFNDMRMGYEAERLEYAGINASVNQFLAPYRAYSMATGGGINAGEPGMPTLQGLQQQFGGDHSQRDALILNLINTGKLTKEQAKQLTGY